MLDQQDLALWMTEAQAAARLGVTKQAVHRMQREGRVRSIKFPAWRLVLRKDVEVLRAERMARKAMQP